MGAKLGAWMIICPFHKAGKLLTGAMRPARFLGLSEGSALRRPIPDERCRRNGMP